METDIATFLDARRDSMRRLFGSILGERVYVALASDLGLTCHANLAGLAGPGLSSLVAENLPHEFIEPRPTIIIADEPLRSGRCALPLARQLFDATSLHEFSHLVADGPDSAGVACDRGLIRDQVTKPPKQWPAHAGPFPWMGHGKTFIRALCHLHHRARVRGYEISLATAFDHRSYGLPSAERFKAALGSEIEDLAMQPIAAVMRSDAAAGFDKLWTDAVVRSARCLSRRSADE